jgi:hypothetical protein
MLSIPGNRTGTPDVVGCTAPTYTVAGDRRLLTATGSNRYSSRSPCDVTADAPTSASDSFPRVDRGRGRHGPSGGDPGENVSERGRGPRLSPVAYVRDLNARHARFFSAVAELRLVRR